MHRMEGAPHGSLPSRDVLIMTEPGVYLAWALTSLEKYPVLGDLFM